MPSKGELPHGMPAMAGASSALDEPEERQVLNFEF